MNTPNNYESYNVQYLTEEVIDCLYCTFFVNSVHYANKEKMLKFIKRNNLLGIPIDKLKKAFICEYSTDYGELNELRMIKYALIKMINPKILITPKQKMLVHGDYNVEIKNDLIVKLYCISKDAKILKLYQYSEFVYEDCELKYQYTYQQELSNIIKNSSIYYIKKDIKNIQLVSYHNADYSLTKLPIEPCIDPSVYARHTIKELKYQETINDLCRFTTWTSDFMYFKYDTFGNIISPKTNWIYTDRRTECIKIHPDRADTKQYIWEFGEDGNLMYYTSILNSTKITVNTVFDYKQQNGVTTYIAKRTDPLDDNNITVLFEIENVI